MAPATVARWHANAIKLRSVPTIEMPKSIVAASVERGHAITIVRPADCVLSIGQYLKSLQDQDKVCFDPARTPPLRGWH